ncbi:MAG: TetR/AcrR family transcriptional regulator [Hyphomonadaceae bacterium]|nr:MAG: regulatory protein TetR [Caulobacteraceae bacterium]MBT9446438.1 TetR/AcrR family transcriptional regulator [Hyphomonadaceae bacterium]TPW04019.1 MAG: regulatory protein TetR [Alphaproteobacteria bacterium]
MHDDETPPPRTRGRPRGRPRDESARAEVLAAARVLLQEGGLTAVTMDRLAARTGVGKPTIYRSWPNAHAVALDALLQSAALMPAVRESAAPLMDLRKQLRKIAALFATPTGRSVALMIAAAQSETELAKVFRHRFMLASREEGRRLLARAIEAGEVRAKIDMEAALDLIYAPLFFRLLVGHGSLDRKFVDSVLDHALAGLKA